ncbi:MAG: hypothetical protein RDV48_22960 [Candidatus Eremiobacteraeota bacterium]|nr:hypothetical protein [Candidatus Eremiobacteraeota bacterium]
MTKKSSWLLILLLLAVPLMLDGCSGSSGGDSSTPFTGSSAPIETGNPNGLSSEIGAYSHDNIVTFTTEESTITFSMTGYDITSGQPWDGVTTSPEDGFLTIDVKCGRKGSSGPLNWVKDWVSAHNANLVYADQSNPYYPGSMNFALTGMLTVGYRTYNICLGQYGSWPANVWMCAGENFTVGSFLGSRAILSPDKAYYILGTGKDYEFVVMDSDIAGAQKSK